MCGMKRGPKTAFDDEFRHRRCRRSFAGPPARRTRRLPFGSRGWSSNGSCAPCRPGQRRPTIAIRLRGATRLSMRQRIVGVLLPVLALPPVVHPGGRCDTAPPSSATRKLSVGIWRIIRPRLAPMAIRRRYTKRMAKMCGNVLTVLVVLNVCVRETGKPCMGSGSNCSASALRCCPRALAASRDTSGIRCP